MDIENLGVDWISQMPDSILHEILSYVSTKNAVGTCILSTRWRNIFPIYVLTIKLDFDDTLLLRPRDNIPNSVFTDFVDRLLNGPLVDGPPVESMIFNCTKIYGDAKITSWVTSALRHRLRELKLMVDLNDSTRLIQSLSGCLTLVKLVIGHGFALHVPHALTFCLPNLKELCLVNLIFDDDEEEGSGSIDRLLQGCQAVEYLCITSCVFENAQLLCIELDGLKCIALQNNDTLCGLDIIAPNLEWFHCSDFAARNYDVSEFLSLIEAHIDVRPNQRVNDEIIEVGGDEEDIDLFYSIRVNEIVTGCCFAVRLHISAPSVEALNHSFIELPKFERLTWLSLGCIQRDTWKVLANLLHNAPNLEKLILEEGFIEPSGGYAIFEAHTLQSPMCVRLRLKEIGYWCFKEEDDEIELLEYFLHQGERLEIVNLHGLPYETLGSSSKLLMALRNCDCHHTKIEDGIQISLRRID